MITSSEPKPTRGFKYRASVKGDSMGRSRTRAARQPVPKPTKPRTKPREKTPEKAKAEKETPDRAYYRETWGFDPVADARDIGDGWRRLEAWFALEHDLPLQAAGVTIGARVDWRGEEVRNRIVFRRESTGAGKTEAEVECTHTLVYTGTPEQVLTLATDLDVAQGKMAAPVKKWLRGTGGPVPLPPWEHFAALKSYIAAITDMGIDGLLRVTGIRDAVATPVTPDAPFGFNVAMRNQFTRALEQVAPEAIHALLLDLAHELLDTAPPAWVHERWQELNFTYPLKEIMAADPDFLLAWLIRVKDATGPPFVDLKTEKVLEENAERVVQVWSPTLVVEMARFSNCLDSWQYSVLRGKVDLQKFKTLAPVIPWDQVRVEWEARQAAEEYADENSKEGKYAWKEPNLPPAEVWPRVPLCGLQFPRTLFDRHPVTNTDPAIRRARLSAYLRELTRKYLRDEELLRFMVDWAKQFRSKLSERLTEQFPDHVKNEAVYPPSDIIQLIDWVRGEDPQKRRAAALGPDVPAAMQEEIVSHWDFATRLALAANPAIEVSNLEKIKQDLQPSVRAIAEARIRRGTPTIAPLIGEILDPGEILWLLVSHPTAFFSFGISTYGDGTPEYAGWFSSHAPLKRDGRGEQGEKYAWAYVEGLIFEDQPGFERGYRVRHIVLDGLRDFACGRYPCMYLGQGDETPPPLYMGEARPLREFWK